jgi:hypothetical protein
VTPLTEGARVARACYALRAHVRAGTVPATVRTVAELLRYGVDIDDAAGLYDRDTFATVPMRPGEASEDTADRAYVRALRIGANVRAGINRWIRAGGLVSVLGPPPWYRAAVSAGLESCAEGEHGFYAVAGAGGRILTDADTGGAIVGGLEADGVAGPGFDDVAAAVTWCAGE